MKLQTIVKAVNGRIEPIRSAVADMQQKVTALREAEASVSQIQEELESAVLAVDAAEVEAAMKPSQATAKALALARSQHKDAQEALDFAQARIRGFRRAIDAEMAGLAQRDSDLAEARSELNQAIMAAYAPKFEAAWAEFQVVLGEGLLLANLTKTDGMSVLLRKNEIFHPTIRERHLFTDHEWYVKAACDATPNREAIEGTLFPVVAEMEQIRSVIEDAVRRTREKAERNTNQAVTRGVIVTTESMEEFRERQKREAAEREESQKRETKARVNVITPLSRWDPRETTGGNAA